MSMGREFIEDHMFEYSIELESDITDGIWTTEKGESIYLEDMSYTHLQNAMSMVGTTSPWYSKLRDELSRRDLIIQKTLKSSYDNMPSRWKKGF